MIKDCSNIKEKNEKTRFKYRRADKRAIIASWSNNDSCGSESEDKETANLFLMARESLEENDE